MATEYGFYATSAGRDMIALALAQGGTLPIRKFGFGQGTWSPGERPADLKQRLGSLDISSAVASTDPLESIIKMQIPPTIGGFILSELSLETAEGTVLFVSKYPATALPDPASASGSNSNVEIDAPLYIGHEGLVEVITQPIDLVTRNEFEGALTALAEATNHHFIKQLPVTA